MTIKTWKDVTTTVQYCLCFSMVSRKYAAWKGEDARRTGSGRGRPQPDLNAVGARHGDDLATQMLCDIP